MNQTQASHSPKFAFGFSLACLCLFSPRGQAEADCEVLHRWGPGELEAPPHLGLFSDSVGVREASGVVSGMVWLWEEWKGHRLWRQGHHSPL